MVVRWYSQCLKFKSKNQYKIKIQYGMNAVFRAISREIPKADLSTVHKHDYRAFLQPHASVQPAVDSTLHMELLQICCSHPSVMTTFTESCLI